MTAIGLGLVLAAVLMGLPGTTTYNGLWLITLIMAMVGVALCGLDTYIHHITTKEKK